MLYRFRAADLLYRPHDALHLAAMWDPSLFSERGRINLHTLASPEARPCRPRPNETTYQVTYETPALDDAHLDAATYPRLECQRHDRLSPNVLLCLFDGDVRIDDCHLEPESLHFGLDLPDRDAQGRNPATLVK